VVVVVMVVVVVEEGQNWGQRTRKWLEKIKWKRLRNRTWT
jgi:hypothetical protein